jgi:hypothetical protein
MLKNCLHYREFRADFDLLVILVSVQVRVNGLRVFDSRRDGAASSTPQVKIFVSRSGNSTQMVRQTDAI